MKVSAEKVAPAQLELTIEVEPERTEQFLQRAYRRLVQRVNIPGFRKGKARRAVVERYLGREALLQQAIDLMVPEVCQEAIKEQGVDALDVEGVEIVQQEPLSLKAQVALRPTVDLGDYHSLRLERLAAAPDEAEVERRLEELRHRYAVLEPVERPVEWGDAVRVDLRGTVDGRAIFKEEDAQFHLEKERTVLVPGLAERLVGLAKGQESEFALTLPEDYPPGLAGKECQSRVVVREVKQERLPPLDDSFARDVGEGFPSLKGLRERLHEDVHREAESQAEAGYREAIVEKLVAMATLEYPAVLVEREIDHLLRDQASAGSQGEVERYLRQAGKTETQIKDELRPQAEARVTRVLALTRVAEVEGIAVTPSEVEEEIERVASAAGNQADEIRRLFGKDAGRDAIGRSLLSRKTLDRLVAVATGQAPSEAAAEESAGPAEVAAGRTEALPEEA